jgi:pyridoxine kinase
MNVPSDPPRAVIVISSHVARGTVGNRAAGLALEALGFPVWLVPTVMLPWHLGHGPGTRIAPDPQQFAAFMADIASAPWLGEVAGVLSGFLGDTGQAEGVATVVRAVKARNPRALYVCDPVIGDKGGLYVSEAVASAIRDVLVPIADIATPNRYELEWLVGAELPDLRALMTAAMDLGPRTMLVTSAPGLISGSIGNLMVTPSEALLAEHRAIEGPPHGSGDLTAALLLARLLDGQPAAKALQTTTASVFEILARTTKRGGDELQIETDIESLSHPMAMVQLRHLTHPGRDRRA